MDLFGGYRKSSHRSHPNLFYRFTDEADQQRALIEMHGLYCLSRPSKSPHEAKNSAYIHLFYFLF